jgi:hypothetical protein
MPKETTMAFEMSPALIAFRQNAGDANRHLNTLLVSVETLQHHEPVKPSNLVVPWSKPTTLKEWDDCRDFILRTAMVTLVDGIDQYLRVMSRVPGLSDPGLGDTLNGRKTGKQRRPTVAERLEALGNRYPGQARDEQFAAIHLLVTWRNVFVHRDYRFGLSTKARRALTDGAAYFRTEHSGADIFEMLKRFDERKPPTLGDLSTLISVAHRVLTALDEHLLHLQAGQDYALALMRYLIKSQADPKTFVQLIWKYGGRRTTGRVHALFLRNGGNHHQNRRESAPHVTRSELHRLFGFGLNRALQEFGLSAPRPASRIRHR